MRGAARSSSNQLLQGESIAPKLTQIKGRVVPNQEEHYVDLALAGYGLDTTGTVTALNLTAEGNDNINRLGRKALMKSVCVRGYVNPTSSAQIATEGRISLVWDNGANGALPAITDIYTVNTSQSFQNVNNVARFTILSEHRYQIGGYNINATLSYADQNIKAVDHYVTLNAVTEYSGTTAAIASVQNGSLLLVTTGTSAAATGLSAGLSTRTTFVDVL
jgi:hypothetical protein